MSSNNSTHNALRNDSSAFKITTRTKVSDEVGAVVCPNCNHTFVKLVSEGIQSNEPINIKRELIQAGASIVTGLIMLNVTKSLILPASAFSTTGSTIQSLIMLITILLLWLSLPVLQYMRIYSLWLNFVYLLNAVFAPIALFKIVLDFVGGAS